MKELWLTRRNDPFMRYKLNSWDSAKLYNGDWTRVFGLQKYWGDGDTWKKWGGEGEGNAFYVDIETLLSEFILLDSPNDKYIKGLEELRDNNARKSSEVSISGFTNMMSGIQGETYDGETDDVFGGILNLNKENEGHTENIHTLYGRKSEVEPGIAPE